MKTFVRLCLILMSFSLPACGAVENWVQSASQSPTLPLNPPQEPDATPVPAAPGYAFSSSGATLTSASYKLRVRFGKMESIATMTGSTHTIRTGKTRHLKDM